MINYELYAEKDRELFNRAMIARIKRQREWKALVNKLPYVLRPMKNRV